MKGIATLALKKGLTRAQMKGADYEEAMKQMEDPERVRAAYRLVTQMIRRQAARGDKRIEGEFTHKTGRLYILGFLIQEYPQRLLSCLEYKGHAEKMYRAAKVLYDYQDTLLEKLASGERFSQALASLSLERGGAKVVATFVTFMRHYKQWRIDHESMVLVRIEDAIDALKRAQARPAHVLADGVRQEMERQMARLVDSRQKIMNRRSPDGRGGVVEGTTGSGDSPLIDRIISTEFTDATLSSLVGFDTHRMVYELSINNVIGFSSPWGRNESDVVTNTIKCDHDEAYFKETVFRGLVGDRGSVDMTSIFEEMRQKIVLSMKDDVNTAILLINLYDPVQPLVFGKSQLQNFPTIVSGFFAALSSACALMRGDERSKTEELQQSCAQNLDWINSGAAPPPGDHEWARRVCAVMWELYRRCAEIVAVRISSRLLSLVRKVAPHAIAYLRDKFEEDMCGAAVPNTEAFIRRTFQQCTSLGTNQERKEIFKKAMFGLIMDIPAGAESPPDWFPETMRMDFERMTSVRSLMEEYMLCYNMYVALHEQITARVKHQGVAMSIVQSRVAKLFALKYGGEGYVEKVLELVVSGLRLTLSENECECATSDILASLKQAMAHDSPVSKEHSDAVLGMWKSVIFRVHGAGESELPPFFQTMAAAVSSKAAVIRSMISLNFDVHEARYQTVIGRIIEERRWGAPVAALG
jgi:hypothetical protein